MKSKAVATARLSVVTNPTTTAPDRVLRLTVCVPASMDNGDEVLKTVLNGFEDTLNLMKSDFSSYTSKTGDIKTGQTVHLVQPKPMEKEPEKKMSWLQRLIGIS